MIVSLSVIFLLALSLWGFYWAIYPLKFNSTITPATYGIPYESISLTTPDNVLIKGWYIPCPNPKAKTLILLHGYPADKGNILPSRLFLHAKFNLLLIDFRYLGESTGKYSTAGKKEVDDLLAAIDFLKHRGIHEVGVWGFSMGGAVALMGAEKSSAIKAVVAESPYAELDMMARDYFHIPFLKYPLGWLLRLWGWIFLGYDTASVSPLNSAKKLSIPILIIHSKGDAVVPFTHARLFDKALKDKKNVTFIFYDQLPHGESPAEIPQIVERFFEDLEILR